MSDQPRAPLTTTTSILPAAAVLGLAVLMLVVFMVINVASNQGVTATPSTIPVVVVGGLTKSPSAAVLNYCRHTSEIPSNISDAFVVPTGTSTQKGATIPNAGAGSFDCLEPVVTRASSGSLLAFYTSQLEARGWSLFSHGASNGAPQELFQKAGNDGFYWVAGVTITSTTKNVTYWTFRIYQNSETV